MFDVLIIHYNTPDLTEAAIRSLWKHTPDARVTVFDNSDKRPFVKNGISRQVEVIDNTKGQVVNWDSWLAKFTNKMPCPENNYGSAKHTFSVEVCMDMFKDGFILMDSDVLIKQDITPICDTSQSFVGKVCKCLNPHGFKVYRVLPMLCWINTPILKQYGIRYFNQDKAWKLTKSIPNCWYDTGASFYEEVTNVHLQYAVVKIRDYILHYCNGSWNQHKNPQKWLEENQELLK